MGVAIHLRIEGVEDLVRAYVRMTDSVARAVPAAVRTGIRAGVREMKTTHRFKNQSGELEKSMDGRITGQASGVAMGEMVARAEHASFVEHGTRPHPIRPQAKSNAKGPLPAGQTRRKRGAGPPVRFLAFIWNGELTFRRVVHHPGTDPQPFMGPAYFKCERVLMATVEKAFADARVLFE